MDIVKISDSFVPTIARLYGQVFAEPPWEEVWTEAATLAAVRNPLLQWWVAVEGDEVQGFIAGCLALPAELAVGFNLPQEDLRGNQIGYLAELGVAQQCRRTGLASRLTEVLLEYFLQHGADGFAVRTRLGTGNYPWYLGRLDILHQYVDGRTLFGCEGLPKKL